MQLLVNSASAEFYENNATAEVYENKATAEFYENNATAEFDLIMVISKQQLCYHPLPSKPVYENKATAEFYENNATAEFDLIMLFTIQTVSQATSVSYANDIVSFNTSVSICPPALNVFVIIQTLLAEPLGSLAMVQVRQLRSEREVKSDSSWVVLCLSTASVFRVIVDVVIYFRHLY
ncbi:ABC transporter B family member 15-like [Dorcoceras hygrometricum]|uniref:ABC transporter B family member 15-like n=1 Tax=Dorcoceras hygrometricum TaxID=472368 RepID=A0A2Z7AGD7_9LAMI|nr:ABC transporter B family member 15-like [Dorcoceras hygrometricum]